ncbi:tyrosine-type recombinase/integrase [Enterococcus sp. AZ196]|uniref:tyrosine-type recombinase/integrase n=1 Tax=Enterococcus sp. AZ196 TaxID=2774659 RepID=UPI003D2DDC82
MSRTGENIYRRKDGRWEGRYIKGRQSNGKLHYGYIYSKSFHEVKEKLFLYKMHYKENYLNRRKSNSQSITLEGWALGWLSLQEKRVKPNTYISYESKMKNHLLPIIGDIPLKELTTKELQQAVNELANKLSPSSLKAVFRVLRTCLNDAVNKEIIISNPLRLVIFPSENKPQLKAFTAEEQERIIQAVNDEKDLPILFALRTGLRIGEIAGLQWSDIDWNRKILYVRHNAQRIKMKNQEKQSRIVIVPPKTDLSHRVVPLSEELVEQLLELQTKSCSEFVFSSKEGPADPRTIRNHFKRIKRIAQVSDLPFHALRHTFATRCIEKDVPVTTVSSLLGHKSVKMTLDIYTDSFIRDKREAISKIG